VVWNGDQGGERLAALVHSAVAPGRQMFPVCPASIADHDAMMRPPPARAIGRSYVFRGSPL